MPTPTDPETVRDEIARRAYQMFCDRGCVHGCDTDDWLAAEREVLSEIEEGTPEARERATPDPTSRPKRRAKR